MHNSACGCTNYRSIYTAIHAVVQTTTVYTEAHAVTETATVNTAEHTVVQTTTVLAIKECHQKEMGHFDLKINTHKIENKGWGWRWRWRCER